MLNTITHEIDLNMSQPNNFQYVHVMQNDYGAEFIKCTLYDGNNPYIISCPKDSITVRCQLPNEREIETGVESTDRNTITFKVTNNMTQVQGNVLVALCLFDTNGRKSPFPFVIKVANAPEGVTDDDIMYGKLSQYYANLSKSYAIGTDNETREGDATDNSKYYCEKAARHAKEASETASNAKKSELSASASSSNASKSERNAADSARKAEQSEKKSLQNNADSKKYADLSKSYAIGTNNSVREDDKIDNSKYYWTLVKNAIDNGQLAEFEYFERYTDFEKALNNNEIREDIIAVIKENIYIPSETDGNDNQIDDALSTDSKNAVQNKVITNAINNLETKIASLVKELSGLKTGSVLGDWEFRTNGDGLHKQNSLLGHSEDNFILTDGNLHLGTSSEGKVRITGNDNIDIISKKININGNGNDSNIYIGSSNTSSANIYLTGNIYINGKLLE